MSERDWSEYIPEGVLEEIMAEEKKRIKKEKVKYPSSKDVVEAIIEATKMAKTIHPNDFPSLVLKILEDRGYDVRHITVKRIWRTYEMLVRKGIISDVLHVVKY